MKQFQADSYAQAQKYQAQWFELYTNTSREIIEKSGEIAGLIVGFPPPISPTIANWYLGYDFECKKRNHEV